MAMGAKNPLQNFSAMPNLPRQRAPAALADAVTAQCPRARFEPMRQVVVPTYNSEKERPDDSTLTLLHTTFSTGTSMHMSDSWNFSTTGAPITHRARSLPLQPRLLATHAHTHRATNTCTATPCTNTAAPLCHACPDLYRRKARRRPRVSNPPRRRMNPERLQCDSRVTTE